MHCECRDLAASFTCATATYSARVDSILASNRDEVLARPSTKSAWHAFPTPREILSKLPSSPPAGSSSSSSLSLPSSLSSPAPSRSHPVLSGIDAHPAGGGTWLGITAEGSFAVLTNFTETGPPPLPADSPVAEYRSRGGLPREWLKQEGARVSDLPSNMEEATQRVAAYLEDASKCRMEYPGFNLLIGTMAQSSAGDGQLEPIIGYLTNRGVADGNQQRLRPVLKAAGEGRILDLRPQGYIDGSTTSSNTCIACGLSNSTFDDPWSKVLSGEQALSKLFESETSEPPLEQVIIDGLFKVLATSPFPQLTSREDFKKSICIPPVQLPVKGSTDGQSLAWYATRLSTILLVPRRSDKGQTKWIERDIHTLEQVEDGQYEARRVPDGIAEKEQRVHEWTISHL